MKNNKTTWQVNISQFGLCKRVILALGPDSAESAPDYLILRECPNRLNDYAQIVATVQILNFNYLDLCD